MGFEIWVMSYEIWVMSYELLIMNYFFISYPISHNPIKSPAYSET